MGLLPLTFVFKALPEPYHMGLCNITRELTSPCAYVNLFSHFPDLHLAHRNEHGFPQNALKRFDKTNLKL
jgi:hypothetical protein